MEIYNRPASTLMQGGCPVLSVSRLARVRKLKHGGLSLNAKRHQDNSDSGDIHYHNAEDVDRSNDSSAHDIHDKQADYKNGVVSDFGPHKSLTFLNQYGFNSV